MPPKCLVEVYRAVYRGRRHLWTVHTNCTGQFDRDQSQLAQEDKGGADGAQVMPAEQDEQREGKEEDISEDSETRKSDEEYEGHKKEKPRETSYEAACMRVISRCAFLLVGVAPAIAGRLLESNVYIKRL